MMTEVNAGGIGSVAGEQHRNRLTVAAVLVSERRNVV
jgi:hypothetical protein